MESPDLDLLDLVVRDMEATIAFYRALGVQIPESAIWRTPSGAHHVDVVLPGGFTLHFDSPALARFYDRGWREPSGKGAGVVIGFRVASRDEVDRIYEKLVGLGHPGAQPPYDAFWGARYAVVEDPDGNHVGLMSPLDPARRGPPPDL
jgi:catechol 2,3-dioxygenase-like lactoylglutathione lyase family enzyme